MSNSAAVRLTKAEQTEKLMRLLSSGLSVRAAAKQLDISERQARRLKDKAVTDLFHASAAATEKVIGQELHTLNMLQAATMPHALRGNLKAVDTVLSIMDRRAKFLGLYAPDKLTVQVDRVDHAIGQIMDIVDGAADPVTPLRRAIGA